MFCKALFLEDLINIIIIINPLTYGRLDQPITQRALRGNKIKCFDFFFSLWHPQHKHLKSKHLYSYK